MPEAPGLERIERRLDEIDGKLDQMNGILETWQAFKTGGQIITWLAKVATALIGVIVFLKIGLISLLGGHKL